MAAPWRDDGRAPSLADGTPPPCAAAPPGSHLCVRAHADAAQLMTDGDAAEQRRKHGPWMDGMVFGGDGHTAARPRRKGGHVFCRFDCLLFCSEF